MSFISPKALETQHKSLIMPSPGLLSWPTEQIKCNGKSLLNSTTTSSQPPPTQYFLWHTAFFKWICEHKCGIHSYINIFFPSRLLPTQYDGHHREKWSLLSPCIFFLFPCFFSISFFLLMLHVAMFVFAIVTNDYWPSAGLSQNVSIV